MRILLFLVVTLIFYGSFFPFTYVPHVPTRGDLVHLFLVWPARVSAVDAAGNLLLFVPLGLCIPAGSPARWRWSLWLAGGIAFAWGLQYLQFWFPSRDPTASDAWFNTAGILLGIALAARARFFVRAHVQSLALASPLWPVASVLMLLWLAYRWFPLVPTLDVDNLRHALRPLLLRPRWEGGRVLHDTAAWLFWFLLLRHSPWHGISSRVAGAFAVAVLLIEPIFWQSVVSLSNVVGLLLALVLRPWFTRDPAAARRVLVMLLASIVVSGLTPWPRAGPPQPFMWMPFAGLLNGNMLGNTAALIEKCYLYGGVVLLLGQIGLRLPVAGLLLASGLWGIEWLQRWSPGRTPEMTDPLLALLLGMIFQTALAAKFAAPGAGSDVTRES
ncbi:MAG TPA: VanZ family protein [Burkholderiaceae bacterium]|nr:VanZ family protein [Burkholderiaceae bacterium]